MNVGIACILPEDIYQKWPKIKWVAEAFRRIGCDVTVARTREELPGILKNSDFVIFSHKSLAGRWPNVEQAIKERTCPIVYWWFDLVALQAGVPLSDQSMFRTFRRQFKSSDIVLIKERGMLGEYIANGVNAHWFDQGCLSDFPQAEHKDFEWDVLLWGQSSTWKERVHDATHLVKSGFKVAWASDAETIPAGVERLPWTHPEELYKLAGRARCVLSCGMRNSVEGYWSDSFWMACAMGNCVVRKQTPGMPDGPYLKYHTEAELVSSVNWVLKNPKLAEGVRKETRKWATTEHSLEERAKSLIQLVETATVGVG